jgi:dATP pyrophosphohydrolase
MFDRRIIEIFAEWRDRYVPGVTHNTEHVFSLELSRRQRVRLTPDEHLAHVWLPWRNAAAKCFPRTNRDAILMLPEKRAP